MSSASLIGRLPDEIASGMGSPEDGGPSVNEGIVVIDVDASGSSPGGMVSVDA